MVRQHETLLVPPLEPRKSLLSGLAGILSQKSQSSLYVPEQDIDICLVFVGWRKLYWIRSTNDASGRAWRLTHKKKFSWAEPHFIFHNTFQVWFSIVLKTSSSFSTLLFFWGICIDIQSPTEYLSKSTSILKSKKRWLTKSGLSKSSNSFI